MQNPNDYLHKVVSFTYPEHEFDGEIIPATTLLGTATKFDDLYGELHIAIHAAWECNQPTYYEASPKDVIVIEQPKGSTKVTHQNILKAHRDALLPRIRAIHHNIHSRGQSQQALEVYHKAEGYAGFHNPTKNAWGEFKTFCRRSPRPTPEYADCCPKVDPAYYDSIHGFRANY